MIAPSPTRPSSPATSPESPGVDAPASEGYLATVVGAVVGLVVLGGLGVGIGLGLMDLYYDPDAGLGNLALFVYPLGLGGIGTLAGIFLGTRTALRRVGDPQATRTAAVAVGLAVLALTLAVATSGLGVPLVLGVPLAARWLVLQGGTAA